MKTIEDWRVLTRRFWTAAIALFLAACTTCYVGVEYEISKIPPDVRSEMTDFDWVGAEWVFGGMGIQLLALLAFASALYCGRKARELTPHLVCGCGRSEEQKVGSPTGPRV